MDAYLEWKGWVGPDFGSYTTEHSAYYREELRLSGIASIETLRVGELGYGNGSFAGWVRNARGRWTGREVIPELQERAAHAGYEVIADTRSFADACGAGAFDLIVAMDVLEHLELDVLKGFLREARLALKSEGLLIFRIPSGDSPYSGPIFRGDLTHRTLLGSAAVRQLAEETGFTVMQVRSPAFPVSGLGLVRGARRVFVSILQSCTFAFVRNILMNDRNAVVSPNMLVVLRNDPNAPRRRQ
jgi:SAM-dependent methyltransferase